MNPEKLIEKALEAQKNSQCKYSNFPVGCALLTNNNQIILTKKFLTAFLNR